MLKEWKEYGQKLHLAVASGDSDKLVMAFVGLVHAEDQLAALRNDKATWQKLSKLAPTLEYDYRIIGSAKHTPDERLAKVQVQTLVMCGSESGSKVAADTQHIAQLIPHGISKVLPGQSHSVEPAVIAPILRNFFA